MDYAHSKPGRPPDEWQPLADHLRQVAEKAAEFAGAFGSGEWGCAAGWLHDLGKAASAFQGYLRRANELDDGDYDAGQVNHSSAGALLAVEHWHGPDRSSPDVIGKTLAYLVAGHHAGLADWIGGVEPNGALAMRLQEGQALLEAVRTSAREVAAQFPPTLRPPPNLKQAEFHLWVRMLFSCLADADYLDTEAFLQPEQTASRGRFAGLSDLKARLDQHLARLAESALPTPVNARRQEVLAACRAAAVQVPGLFSLTVPTGGGKTLSGMAFALDHALQHGKSRIVYVIPYTSIIEQTAAILRSIFGDANVIEHHSSLDPEKETQRSRLAAENWDAPIIVTTNVQFFESLYAAGSSRCRKLHNLVSSVVILDEAQLLPPEWLAPCVDAINRLVERYGVTVVLSTATQPALPGLSRRPTEIVPDPTALYAALRRTDMHMPEDLDRRVTWPDLAAELSGHGRVLCVVNKRQDCFDLHRLMPEDTMHLSALMCGQHRSEVIAAIKGRLAAGGTVRVISTQLVEAGVDLDFPVVYRALAGLDSIAQAAGRCNREGTLAGLGQVHVFVPPSDPPRGLLRKGADTTRELAAGELNPQAPAEYTHYFDLFYRKVNDTGAGWLHEQLVKDVPKVQFRTAAREFRLIDEQCPVFVRYAGSPALLDRLRFAGPTRDLLRRLQRYTVNLSPSAFEKARAQGLIEEVCPGQFCWIGRYDRCTGLDLFGAGLAPEDLVA
jgi:CRISPR-associated endonuclease/helicase Cas3